MRLSTIFLLCLSLASCKKEQLINFTPEENNAIEFQSVSFEMLVKVTGYHRMVADGGSPYLNGELQIQSDTVGSTVYDTLRYYNNEYDAYVHSDVIGYSCSVREIGGADMVIDLSHMHWQHFQFGGTVLVTGFETPAFEVTTQDMQLTRDSIVETIQSDLQVTSSGTDLQYVGTISGTGETDFSWYTTEAFICFADYGFQNINSIPGSSTFTWKNGTAEFNVSNTVFKEVIRENFEVKNSAILIHPSDIRKIFILPFL